MPSLSEVLKFRQIRFEKSYALIEKKGADYNRDQQQNGDTLFNLKVAELLGIVPSTEEGILVRLSDKFMRLISLTKPGREAAVASESVLDTIDDIHNYVDYLGLIWLQRRATLGATTANIGKQAQGLTPGMPDVNRATVDAAGTLPYLGKLSQSREDYALKGEATDKSSHSIEADRLAAVKVFAAWAQKDSRAAHAALEKELYAR